MVPIRQTIQEVSPSVQLIEILTSEPTEEKTYKINSIFNPITNETNIIEVEPIEEKPFIKTEMGEVEVIERPTESFFVTEETF